MQRTSNHAYWLYKIGILHPHPRFHVLKLHFLAFGIKKGFVLHNPKHPRVKKGSHQEAHGEREVLSVLYLCLLCGLGS